MLQDLHEIVLAVGPPYDAHPHAHGREAVQLRRVRPQVRAQRREEAPRQSPHEAAHEEGEQAELGCGRRHATAPAATAAAAATVGAPPPPAPAPADAAAAPANRGWRSLVAGGYDDAVRIADGRAHRARRVRSVRS